MKIIKTIESKVNNTVDLNIQPLIKQIRKINTIIQLYNCTNQYLKKHRMHLSKTTKINGSHLICRFKILSRVADNALKKNFIKFCINFFVL